MQQSQAPNPSALSKKTYTEASAAYNLSYLDNLPIAASVFTSQDLIFFYANEHYCQMVGRSLEEVQGRSLYDVFPELKETTSEELYNSVLQGNTIHFNDREVSLKKGGILQKGYYNVSYGPIREDNGHVSGMIVLAYDVTQAVLSRKEIVESRKQFSLLADAMPQLVWVADADGIVNYYNRRVEEFAGAEFMPDGSWKWQGLLHEEDVANTVQKWKSAVESGEIYEVEHRVKMKDGKYRWMLSRGLPQFDDQGKVTQWFGTATDIHKQKSHEEALRIQEERINIALEAAGQGTWDYDFTNQKMFISPRTAELFNVTELEISDVKKVLDSVDEQDQQRVIISILHALDPSSDGSYDIEYKLKTPNAPGVRYIRAKGRAFFKDNIPFRFIGTVIDITGQKKNEEALAYQKSILETVTDNASLSLFLMDENQQCIYMNEAAEEMTGFKLHELIGKQLHHYIQYKHPDGSPYPTGNFPVDWTQSSNKRESGEEIFIHKNGSTYPVSFVTSPVWSDHKLIGTILEVRNTANEKLKEKEIAESEEKFRTLADSVSQLTWMAHANGKIIWYNKRWYEYTNFGHDTTEIDWEKVVHPLHLAEVKRLIDVSSAKGEPFEHIFPLRRYDGTYRWFLTRAFPHKNEKGEVVRWMGTHTDINEQKLAEDRFRILAETLPQLTWMTDEKGIQEFASHRWKEFTGIEPSKAEEWNSIVHPDDLEKINQAWTASMQTGQPYRGELRLKHKSGVYNWFYIQGEPVRNELGEIIKWIGGLTNIQVQKELNLELEEMVKQRTAELKRSNDDLQQFAHVASHDLKEPVRKIKTFSSRLIEEFQDLLPEKGLNYLKKIDSSSMRMIRMIEGVLHYSSFAETETDLLPVPLAQIFNMVISDLEITIQQTEANISIGEMPVVFGSEVLLHQLFYNLCANALKFRKPGLAPFITITSGPLTRENFPKEFHAMTGQSYVMISIRDNGIGFSNVHSRKIFKTFTRLHAKDQYEGTGLGLALCKKIADRHQGFIMASSEEGEGALFQVILPLANS